MSRLAISPKPKLRKCKVCREAFTKQRMGQIVCGPKCAGKLAADMREKKARAEYRVRKQAMQPKKWWLAKAKAAMHAYVRARDEGKCCISCDTVLIKLGRQGGDYDAGHFRSVGSAKHLEFDERNIHGQCKRCNDHLKGNSQAYEAGLRARYGNAFVDDLKADQAPRHLTIDDFQAIEAHYKAKLKELRVAM